MKVSYLLILFAICLYANDYQITDLKEKTKEGTSFPFFSSNVYPIAASNINTNLQLSIFQNVPKKEKLFVIDENRPRNLYISNFHTIEEKNFISVSIQGEGCGAYCESFNKYFNFDKTTGQEVIIKDLFTKKGILEINKILKIKNIKSISNFIKENNNPSNKEIDEQIQMYQDCLQRRKKSKSSFSINKYTNMLLEKGKLTIEHGRCSNHALRALDDIGTFKNVFSFKFLKPYLSSYGINFLGGKDFITPKNILNKKIWHGKIDNKYQIILTKKTYSGWIYWYTKYNKLIELKSEYKPPFLYLEETKYDKNQKKWITTSLIKLKMINNQLVGTYTNHMNKKTMPIVLK